MKTNHKKKILRFYTELFNKYGYSPSSLGWGSKKGKQSVQFEVLCQIGRLDNCSILDVGCGFADLYQYLKYRKTKVNYYGVDINPLFIKIAKKLYPKIKVEVRDIQKKKFSKKFDWLFFSGISTSCNYNYIKDMMTEMFRICKKGVAMNFVGGVIDYKSKDLFYSDPEKIYSITRGISNRVTIRHDYAPYQFVLYVYKNQSKYSNNVFKEFTDNSKIILDDKLWHPLYVRKKLHINKIK